MTWRGVAILLAYVSCHQWLYRVGDFVVFEGSELSLSINDLPVLPVGHHFDRPAITSFFRTK